MNKELNRSPRQDENSVSKNKISVKEHLARAHKRITVLYVDLAGNATPLWQVKNFQAAWAIPSHNGKYVAIPAPTTECNVWMVENF